MADQVKMAALRMGLSVVPSIDLEKAKQHALLEKHGYSVAVGKEN